MPTCPTLQALKKCRHIVWKRFLFFWVFFGTIQDLGIQSIAAKSTLNNCSLLVNYNDWSTWWDFNSLSFYIVRFFTRVEWVGRGNCFGLYVGCGDTSAWQIMGAFLEMLKHCKVCLVSHFEDCSSELSTPHPPLPFFPLGIYSQNAILNIISTKIMCLLRFSIVRIRPKCKKICQISKYGFK